MTTSSKVSQAIAKQTPEFISDGYPLFDKFLEYYYKSQEKTGFGQNIVNNFLQYLDIDKLDVGILGGATKVVEGCDTDDTTIVVENVDQFLTENGSLLIDDEVIFYEKAVTSPSIAFSPGISYEQVKLKWITLANLVAQFDGNAKSFPLTSQDAPVAPPSAQHLIVSVYNEVQVPGVDFTIDGTNIVFSVAPRTRLPSDDTTETSIIYQNGFIENPIVALDNISGSFGDSKKTFLVTNSSVGYSPIVDEYIYAIYDNKVLIPRTDFTFDGTYITLGFTPLAGRRLDLFSIEAPIPSFGSGAIGFSRVDADGQLDSVIANATGKNYKFEYPPKITVKSTQGGRDASVKPLINGIQSTTLLTGGAGYSTTNPPTVTIVPPTKTGAIVPTVKATVTNGAVSAITIESSGSGYTFTPRLTFTQPGGAILGAPTIASGSFASAPAITNGGQGYTTAPAIYVDEPTGLNGIKGSFQTVLTDGVITSITVLNAGQGYETTPRIAVVDPVGAQVLETKVDGDGRITDIEMLSGGSGYEDIPSVYIVDERTSSAGSGATAVASIFNGSITDINITAFGTGYSAANPPTIFIQPPPHATASVDIGLGEVTGFQVINKGAGYEKCRFTGCARAASGIKEYTEEGNAVFSGDTVAAAHLAAAEVKCLDALFVKRLLDKYTEQYLPDVPQLDYESIDVRSAIKHIKTFYSTKGTEFSVAYLFKLLYGENVSVSYPKDQITKPSAATWSINTILRATLVSGKPADIQDALIQQVADIADPNIKAASALVENFISIKTSTTDIYELVLSEETIQGTFIVPYKTKLAEPLTATSDIITVDSTIGWPERNGEIVIGDKETVRYKEKSLNQFIECTRDETDAQIWDSATEVKSNFVVYLNKGTLQEVTMNVVGIVDANQTTLTDTGSYYLPGDKLTVSKLGGTSITPQLTTWLYNVKKLIEVTTITFGGVNDQSATVTCSNTHGLLVGDQVTVYGANPILYNGTFLVTSRDSATVFQYQLPQPATVIPQGNILISVDLNKGKSTNSAITTAIGPYTTNVQNTFFNTSYVYVASTGIPNYDIGPFPGSALLPGNQRKLNRFGLAPTTISTKTSIVPGPIGTWVNGVSIWSYKSKSTKTFGAVTSVDISNAGIEYDAASPPAMTISGGGGSGATATVTVDGGISAIEVTAGGSGYTSSPLVSIVGGGGTGAAATAIITKGVVSRVLINQSGTGYTSQPEITIVGGAGTGATATASVRGPIKTVNITAGGASYTSKPTVKLSSGSGAVAQAIVNNGRIISIAIISAGSGYTTAPTVSVQGEGFGAVAKATIDVDGENAGKVTGITITNKGIGYIQGTTIINLTSIGSSATFAANVFEWTYNLQETSTFDTAKGAVFEGFNVQYGGEYAHLSNPQKLRYILGDNLYESTSGTILEQETQLAHSPIIGWAFDGNPIYGPYGYSDPTNQSSQIARLNTSYSLKTNIVFDAVSNPYPVRTDGPLLTEESAGKFIEDYEYVFGSGDLDQYNGRFCKTPEFSAGRYCYFVTIDAAEAGNPKFPYIMGPSYNSVVDTWNLVDDAVQQNIPTGVVRYRDPYENVDIDVERTPNASTNALTMENGDILLFDAEDENRDGIITQDEIDDPEQMYEEAPLQLFDYFPKVKFDSKVDIEVDTITKFEDASVTGFTIENSGKSYQVDDRLIFDNTDTDGSGVSARISRIKGETVEAYTYETLDGINYGILTSTDPHNLITGDTVFVEYAPTMDNTNKTFIVRQYKGIEEVTVNTVGSGYNTDIPPTVTIDSDSGTGGSIDAVVSTVGSIESFKINNSGSGYTENPRVILSHPQIYKKCDYYASLISNNGFVKISDVAVNLKKEVFICGHTKDASGNVVALIAKLSATGVKEWEKTLESTAPAANPTHCEFNKIIVDGNDIWVSGISKPNIPVLTAYNPDIILCKYIQADNGLSAGLALQRAYAGISGSTRADNVTCLAKLSSTPDRFIFGGYTNTNSANPFDAFLAVVDTAGSFIVKRKLATTSGNEKITDIKIGTDGAVYFTMETSTSSSSNDINVSFGKATVGTNAITVDWIKEISNTLYSFQDASLCFDEFNEFYVTATCRLKSDDVTKDSFWVGKFRNDGAVVWNKRYVAPARDIQVVGKTAIDIFGELNVAYSHTYTQGDGKKIVSSAKIKYDGTMLKHTSNELRIATNTTNTTEGFTVHALDTDESGDLHLFGQTQHNRNEFTFDFAANEQTDITGHYTLTSTSTNNSITYADNMAKIYGYNPAGSNSSWVSSHLSITNLQLGTKLADDWTLEFFIYKNSSESQTLSQGVQTLCGIGGAQDTTGGLWLGYDTSSGKLQLVVTNNSTALTSGTPTESSQTTMYANNTWQTVGLSKSGDVFKVYINGTQVITGTLANTALGNKTLYFGNQIGFGSGATDFSAGKQGQFYIDNIRLRNRALVPTVPSDITTLPPVATFGLTFDWVDDAWFVGQLQKYDYIDFNAIGIKVDRNSDAARLGTLTTFVNTQLSVTRTAITPVVGSTLTIGNVGLSLGAAGFQSLDFDDANITYTEATETATYANDIWSSRTGTVPSPGSTKVSATAVVKDRYFFKVTDTSKIDNIQELTINQSFNFTVGAKLMLKDGSTFVNSGYITSVDNDNNKVYVAVNNNTWTNDTATGQLSTERFDEQDTLGIRGPIPNDLNEINGYLFAEVLNTTPGTFNIDLDKWSVAGTYNASGGQDLDSFAKFKPWVATDYTVRIDEVASGSPYIVGSVVEVAASAVSFNAAYSTIQITGLTAVLKITLTANLTKILQVSSVSNSDQVYVITSGHHYLEVDEMVYVDGNPSQTYNSLVYDEYDGAFAVSAVISVKEFTYKLPQAAVTDPATTPGNVSIYVKSPTLKMFYGHQYLFDLSHSSLVGGNLSFAKDSLYKLEYSFNSIERIGTPGVTGQGVPTPSVKLKIDENVVTNISYYFDPSRTGSTSPVIEGSYLDVVDSPYKGTFEITSTSGATITRGDDVMRFKLLNEPEGAAEINPASYSTSSKKAVGSINALRIVNSGGFYTRLPIVSNIESTRKIERVDIKTPGTEYAVGVYNGVPIAGDGEGGLISITVTDGSDDEGVTIPGQISAVAVTSPGKNYTTASIDIDSIPGILGSGLNGSGAELVVVIPSSGSGASIFTKGTSVGKIKKLKNNNFGYDYPHDYTLRPEITFPLNCQLTSTSILASITVTDPGSGYSQAPAVVITGGGGSGAQAEATIKNGRLDNIIVKDPGAGYSSTPTIELKSSFNYVVNLDLGLLQFAFPHGIANGSEVTLNVVDTGDGAEYPLAAGATGRLNSSTTYFAIAGTANSLETDQLKLAITAANASLGDALSFVNAGTGRQQVLTSSFGGGATANVATSVFDEGELVYQGDTFASATATGYVSENNGWQIGPRILKIVDYTGDFIEGQKITGVISKSSGVISDLNIAKGVLEIGSITQTTGQFVDDVGKPSEIIQKIQDSYYYQDFSYAVNSATSISEWKDILIRNVHPASFKVFGELNLQEYGTIPNKSTAFELTKSVELAQSAIVPNIQNFALVEPIYQEFNNTEVLFRQKRLTSSENILTSVVQRIDNIDHLFDGERTAFPLTVSGSNVVANANQLMIVLNGIAQQPNVSFSVQSDNIVFVEPPSPPASVKYASVTITQIATKKFVFSNQSGIYPTAGMYVTGSASSAKFRVTTVVGNDIYGYITEGTFVIGELCNVSATGFSANLSSQTDVVNNGLFMFGEVVTNFEGNTAKIEEINLAKGQETPLAKLRYTIGQATTSFEVVPTAGAAAPVAAGTFVATKNYQFGSEIFLVNSITDGAESTTLGVTRAQLGTAADAQLENTPLYGTDITITNALILSKTTGTYQSTPGLFDIQLNDIIIAAKSGVVATVASTSPYQDPVTNEFISQVNISEGSSFFGLLFNRITSQTYPNVVLDNIAESQVSIVDFTDNVTAFDSKFPANELINNYVIKTENISGTFQENEFIRNFKIDYGNNSGTFLEGEEGYIRKLTFTDKQGAGFFNQGNVIRSKNSKAEVIGYNQARSTVYLGKMARALPSGADYFTFNFNGTAQIDTAQYKFGASSLSLPLATDFIDCPSSTEIALGSSNFTLELWVRASAGSLSGTVELIDTRASSANEVAGRLYLNAGKPRWNVNNSDLITTTTTLVADTWTHIAIVRTGTAGVMWINGVSAGTGTDSTTYVAKPLHIGASYAGTGGIIGHLDEIRWSNSARYSATFAAPTGIFQGDANTKLLLHCDGADTATYVEDWSGTGTWIDGDDFNNDAIIATKRKSTGNLSTHSLNTQRYLDAADLIFKNKDLLAKEVVWRLEHQSPYAPFSVLTGSVNCSDDVNDILDALISDMRNGSNSYLYDAAALYVDRTVTPITVNHIETEIEETIWTHEELSKLAQQVITNQRIQILGDHGLTQVTDSSITDSTNASPSTITPTAAVYDAVTGEMTLTKSSHGLTTNIAITATGATYDANTGIMVVTSNSHGLNPGDKVKLEDNSITFSCDMDGNRSDHSYPRADDPASGKWLEVGEVQTNTFEIFVDKAPLVGYKPTASTYDAATGLMALTIGDHNFSAGQTIKLANNSLNFTCAMDDNNSIKSYPRSTDNVYDEAIPIKHEGTPYTPTGATYTPVTGEMVVTIIGHTIAVNDQVKLEEGAVSFSCAKDNHASDHSYPLASSTVANTWLTVSAVTANTLTINVGKSPDTSTHTYLRWNANSLVKKDTTIVLDVGKAPLITHDVSTAAYTPATGVMDITLGTHNFLVGDSIKLADGSLTFSCNPGSGVANGSYPRTDIITHTPTTAAYVPATGVITITVANHGMLDGEWVKLADGALTFKCDADSQLTNHAYPRATDPISGRWIQVSGVTTNTFDIQVLDSAPSSNTSTHVFVSATSGGVSQKKDRSYDSPIAITGVGTANLTAASGTTYNPSTGVLSITSASHGLTGATSHTPTLASYAPATGLLTITLASHGFANGDRIQIQANALTMTCAKDSDGSFHTYPRSSDPVSEKWLPITLVDANSFTVDVNKSPDLSAHTFISWASNGIKRARDMVKFDADSLTFSCALAGGNHTYPRLTDPIASQWVPVTNVATNTFEVNTGPSTYTGTHTWVSATSNGIKKQTGVITVNVGISSNTAAHTFVSSTAGAVRAGGVYAHTFKNANNTYTPSTAAYVPATGVLTLTIAGHGFANGEWIKIADSGLTFTCAQDSNATNHTYPRAAGATFTATTGTAYNPSTGILSITTTAAHNLANGDEIKIADNSLTFTCAMDGNTVNKTYPRPSDPISAKWIKVENVASTTFDVQILDITPSSNTSTHVWVSATAGGIQTRDPASGKWLKISNVATNTFDVNVSVSSNTSTHAFVSAISGCVSRAVIMAGGAHSHTWKSAKTNGIHKQGSFVSIDKDALKFKCALDEYLTDHTYPALTSTVYNKVLPVEKYTTNTFTVNVGISTQDDNYIPYTPTAATYTASTGALVLDIGTHSLSTSDFVEIDDNSLTFTCAMDSNQSQKTYPRTFHDTKSSGKKLAVTAIGSTSHTPSFAAYLPTTGVLTITLDSHGFTAGEKVKFDDSALTFSCAKDSNATNHAYPRATDPASGKWLTISNVTVTTFDVQIGVTTELSAHNFQSAVTGGMKKQNGQITVNVGAAGTNAQFTPSAATYNAVTGDMTLTIGQHGIQVGSNIVIANDSLTFSCTMGSGNKTYPRSTDPFGGSKSIRVDEVGYTSKTATGAAYTPGTGAMTITSASHGFSNNDYIQIVEGSLTMRCARDGNTTDHSYPRKTDPYYGKWLKVSNVATNTFDVNVGISPDATTHTFVSAATDGIRKQNGVITVNVGKSPAIGFDVSAATYDPATGLLVATIGEHSFTTTQKVRLANNSFVFKCAQNSSTTHTYPRANGQGGASADDPAYDDAVTITAVTSSTITLNVGTSSNTTAHTFQNANNTYTATGATYTPSTGVMTITSNGHGFLNGERIKIADNSLTFTCAKDGNATNHTYPRSSDPISGKWLTISNKTTNTFDVNVGDSTNYSTHAFVSAVAGGIKRAVIHAGGEYAHTFVSASSNAVSYTPDSTHTFVSAKGGAVKQWLGTHSFVSAIADCIKIIGYNNSDCIDVQSSLDNLLSILIDTLDEANQAVAVDHLATITKLTPAHEYVGATADAYLQIPFTIDDVNTGNKLAYTRRVDETTRDRFRDAANLIRLNRGPIVDKASADMLTRYPELVLGMPRNADASGAGTLRCKTDLGIILDGVANDIEVGGNYNTLIAVKNYLGNNDEIQHVRLQLLQSLYAHNRLGLYAKQAVSGDLDDTNTDSVIIGDWGITNDTANVQFTPSAGTYDPATGEMTLTIGSHTLDLGRKVTIADNSLSWSCTYGSATHTFVGTATNALTFGSTQKTVTAATYNHATGIIELTIGSHSYTTSDTFTIATNSLTFTCDADSHATQHTYPRAGDPAYGATMTITAVSGTTVSANVGAVSGGQTKTYPRATDYAGSGKRLTITAKTSTTITFNMLSANGGVASTNLSPHTFVSATANAVVAPGDCVNVKDAIDSLTELANETLAPNGDRYRDAGDLLHFNKDYIAEEAVGILDADFSYTLNNILYQSFQYPSGATGRDTCKKDIGLLLDSVISDLQTGGNSNTIAATENYIAVSGGIKQVEDQLLSTIHAFKQVKKLGKLAIINNLYNQGIANLTGDQYPAMWTTKTAYRDTTITDSQGDTAYLSDDCTNAVYAFENLLDIIIDTLTPSGDAGRSSARMILNNKNYYDQELENLVNSQWGSGAWSTDINTFLETTVNDVIHDLAITDTEKYDTARNIILTNVIGEFVVGETVTSSGGGYATVKEYILDSNTLVIGSTTGQVWAAVDDITGALGTTATVVTVGPIYDYYTTVSNVQSLATTRIITTGIADQVAGINLFTNPEDYTANWTANACTISGNVTTDPDDQILAEKLVVDSSTGEHTITRNYSLTAYDTFDDSSIKWDDGNNKFDEGATTSDQTFTFSAFIKKAEYDKIRFAMILDDGTSAEQNAFFDLDLTNASFGSVFTPQQGITANAYGSVPVGGGWIRAYIQITLSYGFSTLTNQIIIRNTAGSTNYTGDSTSGIYVWGAKLTKSALDPYVSAYGTTFYADNDFNIKNYILDTVETQMQGALEQNLASPSPGATFTAYTNSTLAKDYDPLAIQRVVRYLINMVRQQLKNNAHYTDVTNYSAIATPAKTYGTRNIPIPLGGGINNADNFFGATSGAYAEVENITANEAELVQIYTRFRIDGTITDGPFTMNEAIQKQGNSAITGIVYGSFEDANFKYLDVKITAGTFAVLDTIVGATNSTTCQINALETRMHFIDKKGAFDVSIGFEGYKSGATADVNANVTAEAAVLTNTGGKLVVDTETLIGTFEKTAVVYAENSRQFLEVSKFGGLDVAIGNRIVSNGYTRIGISVLTGLNNFTVGNRLYKVVSGVQDTSNYAIITSVDLGNNFLYIAPVLGTMTNGDIVGDYGAGESFPVGYASITTKVVTAGAGAALVQDIETVGVNKRIYMSDIVGTFDTKDAIKSLNAYEAVVVSKQDIKARVKRSFRGFDGVQTQFKLTQNNGTAYLPDPEGHMLIFVNGILQPPGASNAYTAFSDTIQFTEAPTLGSAFTGFYVGKLRQLDDISFDFDSLRQSFNLKRNGVFYSLTLTEGVQSTVIRPENNIICSLNGVIQEPGIGFEIVGSRIIFSEIPRVGSTFVAFSYVGSEADVDAAEVVPPIEPGDFIDIQGETSDREVAVIESSNSLITFDYLGSVFGKDAVGAATVTSGTIDTVQVTAVGSGYTTRPTVRVDSISGFDAQIKALIGVGECVISAQGSGYSNPGISVDTSVPDDWTAPDLSQYGEEVIDPEILP